MRVHWNGVDHEKLLELGFVLFAGSFLAGFAVLVGGRVAGAAARQKRHLEVAPLPGVIAAERHQQLATSPR